MFRAFAGGFVRGVVWVILATLVLAALVEAIR